MYQTLWAPPREIAEALQAISIGAGRVVAIVPSRLTRARQASGDVWVVEEYAILFQPKRRRHGPPSK